MSPLGVVVLIVLVDLLGFSLVMPLLAPFAKQYGFSEWQIGLLFSAYPMCQLVAGPILGRLSDRYGRRPLLIVSQAGTAVSFLILGLSREFWVMLLARMLDGASGGNILVAQAYVADVTKPEHRARGMGLIGMAFGLGFVLGPLLGGPAAEPAGVRGLAATAAVPGGGRVLDRRLGARADPAARVAAAATARRVRRAGPELARDGRHGPAARHRPARPGRLPRRAGVRGVRGDVRAVPGRPLRLGARARRRSPSPRSGCSAPPCRGADPPPGPPVRRAAADRRRDRPGRLGIRRAGDGRPDPRAWPSRWSCWASARAC